MELTKGIVMFADTDSSTAERVMNVFQWTRDVTEEDNVLMEKMKCFARNLRWRRSLHANRAITKFPQIKFAMECHSAQMVLMRHTANIPVLQNHNLPFRSLPT